MEYSVCTCRWTKESPAPFVISAWSSSPLENKVCSSIGGAPPGDPLGKNASLRDHLHRWWQHAPTCPRPAPSPTAHRSNLFDSALAGGRFCQPRSVTLHDELRELVDTFGQGLLGDADQFRAALDDYLPENAALPGQLNVLYDAVRFGAYQRCVELLERGSEPMLAVST